MVRLWHLVASAPTLTPTKRVAASPRKGPRTSACGDRDDPSRSVGTAAGSGRLALEACVSLCGRRQRRRMLISSRRCRTVRPPSVLEWAIPHWLRRRVALTVPIFGTASRRLRTRAVWSQAGGSARIGASSIVPAASCFFRVALALRISFACSSPRRRCSLDLAGGTRPVRPAATQAILEPYPGARQA